MEMTSLPSSSGTKRVADGGDPLKNEPDTPEPKRQFFLLKDPVKVKCLHLMLQTYEGIIDHIVTLISGSQEIGKDKQSLVMNITLANQIVNMIRIVHNIRCQEVLQTDNIGQLRKEYTKNKDFKVLISGEVINIKKDDIMKIWDSSVLSVELSYSNELWFDTLNLLMDHFSGFRLRQRELFRGLEKFVINNNSDTHYISKYMLSDRHHALLEGITFPHEIRRRMIRSIGPMTALLCMLLSSEKNVYVYHEAVLQAMDGNIPCIDVIIGIIMKGTWKQFESKKLDMAIIIKTIADILLLNTVRPPTIMFFPFNFLAVAAGECRKNGELNLDKFLDFFSFSGSGGFYTYKILNEVQKTHKFTMRCKMTEEIASQFAFHCLFGSFKEDFGVLSSITHQKSWLTRRDFNNAVQSDESDVNIELIPFNVYPKVNCAKQTLPVSVDTSNIYCVPSYCVPVFSGYRIQSRYTWDTHNPGSYMPQIKHVLCETLVKLEDYLEKNKESVEKDKICLWQDWESLELGIDGEDKPDFTVVKNGCMFIR